jgi:hypothetical protein
MDADIEGVRANESYNATNIQKHPSADPRKPLATENLADVVAPHPSYEGHHRFDPTASWSIQEEKAVVWKTDVFFLGWVCIMVSSQIFPNSSNFKED